MSEQIRTWRIGELAEQAGITVRTLHHYDRLGLLSPSSRTAGGHRCYTGDDVLRLHRIVALRSCGLSLEEIGVALSGAASGLGELLRQQVDVVDERIRQAVALRVRLRAVLDALGRMGEPSITEILRLIEGTTTMNQPLTAEQFAQLRDARNRRMGELDAEQLNALTEKLHRSWAALSADEQRALTTRRRAMLPVDGEG